jgi:hypothetical protein
MRIMPIVKMAIPIIALYLSLMDDLMAAEAFD